VIGNGTDEPDRLSACHYKEAPHPTWMQADAVVVPFPFLNGATTSNGKSITLPIQAGCGRALSDCPHREPDAPHASAGVAEHLIRADVAPVEQIFRDGIPRMFESDIREEA
jgi:hypothetical protein